MKPTIRKLAASDVATLVAHRYAEIFPEISKADYEVLKEDIKQNGIRQRPILTFDRYILDGRSRIKAALELGIDPIEVEQHPGPGGGTIRVEHADEDWDKQDADHQEQLLGLAVSLNLARRHLSTAQRGAIGAELAGMKPGGDRQSKGPKKNSANSQNKNKPSGSGGKKHSANSQNGSEMPDAEVAKLLNISVRSVSVGRKILTKGIPEVHTSVKAGNLSLNKAEGIVDLAKSAQQAALTLALAPPPPKEKEKPKKKRQQAPTQTPGPAGRSKRINTQIDIMMNSFERLCPIMTKQELETCTAWIIARRDALKAEEKK